jgi:hypothetical protein
VSGFGFRRKLSGFGWVGILGLALLFVGLVGLVMARGAS